MKNLIVGLFLTCITASAQPTLTTITDTIYNSVTGTLFNGTVVVQGPNITAPGNVPVLGISRTITITNGAFAVVLVPNTTASPTSTYSMKFSNGDLKTCTVPTSGSPITLAAAGCVDGSQQNVPQVVALAQLASGGATPGQALVFNGTSWAPASISAPTTVKVMISAAQLATLSSTVSVQVIPAVAGKSYFILGTASYFHFGTTPYTFSGTSWQWVLGQPGLSIDGVANAGLYSITITSGSLTNDQYTIAAPVGFMGTVGSFSSPSYVGQAVALYLQSDGTPPIMSGGDGTLDLYITYLLI